MSMRSSSSSDDETPPAQPHEAPAAAVSPGGVDPLSSLLHRVMLADDADCLDELARNLKAADLGLQGLLDLLSACDPEGRPITAGGLRQLLLPLVDAVGQASTAAVGLYRL